MAATSSPTISATTVAAQLGGSATTAVDYTAATALVAAPAVAAVGAAEWVAVGAAAEEDSTTTCVLAVRELLRQIKGCLRGVGSAPLASLFER